MSSSDGVNNPFSQMTNDSLIAKICFIINVVEFSLCFPSLVLIIFCSVLIYRTYVLHMNLKLILLAQFFGIFYIASNRFFVLLWQFFIVEKIFEFAPPIVLAASIVSLLFLNLVGHVMVVERLLATIYVEKYEHFKSWLFTICWICITVPISIAGGYHQIYMLHSMQNVSDFNLLLYCVTLVASFVEIFIFSLITRYNKKKYFSRHNNVPSNNAKFLSARYQLTENMHTGQQLMPNFICHFCTSLALFVFLMTNYFGLINDLETFTLFSQMFLFVNSFCCFILPILMIVFHPLLHRKACLAFRKFKSLFCRSSVAPVDEVVSVPLQNLAEKNAQTEAHFKQLNETWN